MTENSANSYQPNRRFGIRSSPWKPYVGDFKALDTFLASKDGWGWFVPKFICALLRGVGQVIFCNNPIVGLGILLALFWACPMVGVAAVTAATTAILTAVTFRQEASQIHAGLTTYNAVLVGTVTASIWTPMYGQELNYVIWLFIILMSAISVFINASLCNLLGSFKMPLPTLTFPFNIMCLLLFTCLMPGNMGPAHPGNSTTGLMRGPPIAMEHVQQLPEPFSNNTIETSTPAPVLPRVERGAEPLPAGPTPIPNDADIEKISVEDNGTLHWGKTLQGILLSMGQVYGINNMVASCLMLFCTLLYSPTVFFMSVSGAILGTIFGIAFSEPPYEAVYNGLWGFNAILSAIAIGGFFYVLTMHSYLTAMVNVVFTVIIQHALTIAFGPLNLPVLTMPFVLSTFLFLQMTATGDHLRRVLNLTTPEIHRAEYLAELKANAPEALPRDTTDEIAEEKELVLKEVKVLVEGVDEKKDEQQKIAE